MASPGAATASATESCGFVRVPCPPGSARPVLCRQDGRGQAGRARPAARARDALRRPGLLGDRADVMGGGAHLVDGVRGRARPSGHASVWTYGKPPGEHMPTVGRRGVAATAPERSVFTAVA
ncbi:hypothetical protein [Streptomyces sp. NPDC050982]|uniref:hypothetical protein n=1 Tax=Streptomyces sp. NPDC050982 TaxID=3154746 RepID=UPI00340C56D2